MKQFLTKVKRYFKENPDSSFIVGFEILLVICAGLLIQDNLALANEIAIYAYYLLIAGVALQVLSLLRQGKEN